MNADGIARFYRWLEYAAFGRTLESARVDFLSHVFDILSCSDAAALIAKVGESMAPGALWLITEFQERPQWILWATGAMFGPEQRAAIASAVPEL